MATRIANAAQNAAVDAVVDLIDAGAGAGTLKIMSGTQPADADDAGSGTVLATITLADPAYGAASAGAAALASTPRTDTSADASGTAGWFRIEDSNGNNIIDGSVTATGGGGDLELDSVSITAGQSVSVTALPVSIPASE